MGYLYVSLNAQIRNITLLQLRIITIRSIKRRHRIMPQYTVFRHCCRSQCLGIFVKQTVMPHTKSDHNIQVRFRLVQKLCLQDRITHIHTDTFAAFRMPTDVFFCVPALQLTPYTSKPCLRSRYRTWLLFSFFHSPFVYLGIYRGLPLADSLD